MRTQADWGVLSLTLITTVATFESASIKDGSSLQQEQCDLRCFLFSSLHHFLSVFYPQGCSRLSPKASWINVYLLGKLWLVCACVCVCVSVSECVSGLMSVLAVVDLCTMGRALPGCEERMRKRTRSARCRAKRKKKVSKYVKQINFHP